MCSRPQPVLRDDDLVLRPWSLADADAVVAAFDDSAIQQWHSKVMAGEAEASDWINGWARAWTRETEASWAVTDGVVLGQIGLRRVVLPEGRAEFSYWTLPTARGHGVAGRALTRLQRWCADELGLHRTEVSHSVANTASCRVATKAGFPLEARLHGRLKLRDGWHDEHLHAWVAS
jgi:RimJ/RimL family protein N-acetyltransferase